MAEGHTEYDANPPFATASPASPAPTAEEYQRLLSEVSNLRQHMENREISFRNDLIRERRRRETMEDQLRDEFRMMNTRTMSDEGLNTSVVRFSDESLPRMDEEEDPACMDNSQKKQTTTAAAGLSLKNYALNPKGNAAKFSAKPSLDSSNRSDGIIDLAGDNPTEEKDNDIEGTDIPLLPQDTFSFLAFSKLKSISMFVAVGVIGVQLLTLTVLFLDKLEDGEPGNLLAYPKGINQSTATIQVVALFIITVGQTDLHDSLNTLFIGYQPFALSIAIGRPAKKWRWSFSLWVRISITLYALGVTFVMICTESDTTQC